MARHDEFETRFDELASLAYQAAFRLSGDRSQSEEIAQETMARAFRRWSRIRDYAEPWVVRVATNEVIGSWRRRNRAPLPARPTEEVHHDELSTQRMALVVALKRLPRRQREAVALRYIADLSIKSTAQAMGCTESSVKAHAKRALESLRADPELRIDGPSPEALDSSNTSNPDPPLSTEPDTDRDDRNPLNVR